MAASSYMHVENFGKRVVLFSNVAPDISHLGCRYVSKNCFMFQESEEGQCLLLVVVNQVS